MLVLVCACLRIFVHVVFSNNSNIFCSAIVVATKIEEKAESEPSTYSDLKADNHVKAAAAEDASAAEASGVQTIQNGDVESGAIVPDVSLNEGGIDGEAAEGGKPSENGVCLDHHDASKEENLPLRANTNIDCNLEASKSAEEGL